MAFLTTTEVYSDHRGSVSVIDRKLPFDIKRVFYIYDAEGSRGGHRHRRTRHALICVNGSCWVKCSRAGTTEEFLLDRPDKCLIIEPEEWRVMERFSPGAVLLALASEHYDPDDYIIEWTPREIKWATSDAELNTNISAP